MNNLHKGPWIIGMLLGLCLLGAKAPLEAAEGRPNILWITSEDHGPQMGCYGDRYAKTPNVDALAARGMIYKHAWSCAPVCAPARTTLITGMYAPALGAEHMRSLVESPVDRPLYPQLLRKEGYYCTNHSKEDYNVSQHGAVWDESSGKAHWQKRAPNQPFFAVFNSTASHEGKLRGAKGGHDPAGVRVPAYHPDTPEVRADWAHYYDTVTKADEEAGMRLQELEKAGLTEETIVFYYADHGSGMPRSKRWPCDSGLHVPLVVYIPEKFKALRPADYVAGGASERLVSFVDFAPTLLSLIGVKPPEWMQGHAFMGLFAAPPQEFLYGFRGRMDERYDLVRTVTDGRYVYLRNYMPHLSQGQHVQEQFATETTVVWRKMFDEGKLNAAQSIFWQTPKAPEELYDLQSDPDEVRNLAGAQEQAATLARMRAAQEAQVRRIHDLGFLPEGELHRRAGQDPPYVMGQDEAKYPLERIFAMAKVASSLAPEAEDSLRRGLADTDGAVRYWAAMGLLMRGPAAVAAGEGELLKLLGDDVPDARIAGAWALAKAGSPAAAQRALAVLAECAPLGKNNVFVSMAALTAIDNLGEKAGSLRAAAAGWPASGSTREGRYGAFVPKLLQSIAGGTGKTKDKAKKKAAKAEKTEKRKGKEQKQAPANPTPAPASEEASKTEAVYPAVVSARPEASPMLLARADSATGSALLVSAKKKKASPPPAPPATDGTLQAPAPAAAAPVVAPARKGAPNVVLVMADDQGWGDTGYNGHPDLKTPNLDDLAKAGLRLDRFYAGHSNCSPTRGSVMTGRHPNRYGTYTPGSPIRAEEMTVAQVLQGAGYATGHFGKWHLNGKNGDRNTQEGVGRAILASDPLSPGRLGFQEWVSADNFFDLDPVLGRNGVPEKFHGDGSDVVTEEALKFIRRQAEAKAPFLAVVWFGSPHKPHEPLPADKALYARLPPKEQDYYGELTGVDRSVGRLRQGLRDLHLSENTLFWYCSDNGGDEGPKSTGYLRGGKSTLWEGGIRVPGIVEWPARIRAPFVSEMPCSTLDIYPTVLAAAGVTPRTQIQPLDGVNLLPLFDGQTSVREKPIPFWMHSAHGAGPSALLEWPYKLHLDASTSAGKSKNGRKGESVSVPLLYDVSKDPKETTDLALSEPDRVARMSAALKAWKESVEKSLKGEDYLAAHPGK